VTSIGDYAFYCYDQLMNVSIPDSVLSIGYYALAGCDQLTNITISKAKANLLWLIGHYCQSILIVVPDILRTYAKSFNKEDLQVKYQILNLGAKLVSVDPKHQNLLLFEYVLNLARYDTNFDLRDKARFYRTLVLDQIRKYIPKNKDEKSNSDNNNEINKEEENKNKDTNENENAPQEDTKPSPEETKDNQESETNPEEKTNESNEDNNKNGDQQDVVIQNDDTLEIENNIKSENAMNVLNSKTLEELLSNLQKLLISNNKSLQMTSTSLEDEKKKYTLGSLSHCVNSNVKGYVPLPDWPETTLNEAARQENYLDKNNEKSFSSNDKRFKNFSEIRISTSNQPIKTTNTSATANKRYITLDDFYNSTDEDDSEEESSEEEEEEEESSEEETSEVEEEDDDDDDDE